MTAYIEEQELLKFLMQVEAGSVLLTPTIETQGVYAGNVEYIADNGWRIVIFNDADEWDYIDNVTAADGRTADFEKIELMSTVNSYEPTEKTALKRYRIPENTMLRCKICNIILRHERSQKAPLFCATCKPTK